MHVCVVNARARVLSLSLRPRPDIYCNYYVRAKFKPGGVPSCYDARGNTAYIWRFPLTLLSFLPPSPSSLPSPFSLLLPPSSYFSTSSPSPSPSSVLSPPPPPPSPSPPYSLFPCLGGGSTRIRASSVRGGRGGGMSPSSSSS